MNRCWHAVMRVCSVPELANPNGHRSFCKYSAVDRLTNCRIAYHAGMAHSRPIVILGPTAGGKSDLAVMLAERHGPAEIISADSMQIYRHLDAGTAKPSADLRARVPHHLIDIVEPSERFTVAHWLEQADGLIADMQARGIRPIVVGGTNLYIKALLEGMFNPSSNDAQNDPDFRASLESLSNDQLHGRLQAIDTDAAARIHLNDRKRIVRALEVHHRTGQRISALQTQWEPKTENRQATKSMSREVANYRHDPLLVGLQYEPAEINPRINHRVKAMFYPHKVEPALATAVCPCGESLVDECRRLLATGVLQSDQQAAQALGYKQIIEHFEGRMTLDEAFERTKILTRRFAKQQRTWLRRFRGVRWLTPRATASHR